jgi:proteasome lid subunit RPN8/RPN11
MWQLDESVLNQIRRISKASYPKEGCGLLAGYGYRITEAIPVRNSAEANRVDAFELDPKHLIESVKYMREKCLHWLGVFHSHPFGTTVPSTADLADWHYPQLLYGIAAREPSGDFPLYLYKLEDGRFAKQSFIHI